MNNAYALPAIQSGNGSLEQYIHTVNSIPMLSQEEETRLAERRIKRRPQCRQTTHPDPPARRRFHRARL